MLDGPTSDEYKEQLAVIGFIFKLDKESHPFIKKLNIKDMSPIESLNIIELFDLPEKKAQGGEEEKDQSL